MKDENSTVAERFAINCSPYHHGLDDFDKKARKCRASSSCLCNSVLDLPSTHARTLHKPVHTLNPSPTHALQGLGDMERESDDIVKFGRERITRWSNRGYASVCRVHTLTKNGIHISRKKRREKNLTQTETPFSRRFQRTSATDGAAAAPPAADPGSPRLQGRT